MPNSIKPSYQKIIFDTPFPVRSICMHSQKGIDLFYCHWHHNIEFIHVTKGKVFLNIDNNHVVLLKDDICILNPNQVHYGNTIDNIDSSVHLVVLSYDLLPYSHDNPLYQKYIQPLAHGDYLLPQVIHPSHDESDIFMAHQECRKLILRLIDYGDKSFKGREIAVQGAFLELLAAMHHHNLLVKKSNIYQSKIGSRDMAILEYVEKNFTLPLSISEISNHFSINEDYFYRLFKKSTGQTPITFIHQLRIRYAKQLLKNTDMNVSEIAFQVGFSSCSYFTKIFRRHTGQTPKAYRTEKSE